jgi:serine/threonine-protein kinase
VQTPLDRLTAALADRYALERELGQGGMATVYLARDLRHDRKVALKVLRPELAAVIGAERFLAEIKTTAALQHPHILPLFDSGQADSFLFYVMPYVEGESLRDRLNREKQLPVTEAVRIASEVASALDYAHRHGVIHRDIKPENVLLHEGQALVADFGIALAVSQAGGARMTETGLSLGTPGYMSPEQATGDRLLDARSDVYSLGCLLYEMLAGEPPHTGPTVQAVIAAVVTKTPERLTARRNTVPPQIEAAVHQALAKLPADRFATAEAFQKALTDPAFSVARPVVEVPRVGTRAPLAGRNTLLLAALAGVLAIVAAWGWMRPGPVPLVTRYSLYFRPSEQLRGLSVSGNRLAISPDGARMVYLGPSANGTALWLRQHDQLRATLIPGTEGVASPFFSPDGRSLGFLRSGTSVRTISLQGGPPLTLSDSINSTGGDWGPDGYIYIEVDSGIARIRATGGSLEPVYKMSTARHEIGCEWPLVLPGARGLVFRLRHAGQGAGEYDLMAMKLPRGEAHVLMRGVYARYAASGHLLVVTADGKLLAVPFDAGSLSITGPPIAMAEGLEVRQAGFGVDLGLSKAGTLVYTTGVSEASRTISWVDRDGRVSPVDTGWKMQGVVTAMGLSPDGKSVVVALQHEAKGDVWVKQLPAGPFSRITFGDSSQVRPAWSADGRSVVYLLDPGNGGGIPYIRRADGTGTAERLLGTAVQFGQISQSSDGKWLILRRVVTDPGNGDIFGAHQGDSALVPLVTGPATEVSPALSPDGRWLAYVSDESGTTEVYVRPFPAVGTARWQASTAGGRQPVWSHSGRELFYINGRNELISAEVRPGPAFSLGKQTVLFTTTGFNLTGALPTYAITPDDRRFLMVREGTAAEGSELIVAENWLEELKARTGK